MTRTIATTALLLPDPAHSFWARIAHELADAIGSGIYAPGERLPSEHSLAEQFGVNRHTIRRSLASLGQIGLVRSSQGSGTYVEDFAVDLVLGRRTRHRQSLAQAGLPGGMQVLDAQTVRATADVAKALEIRTGATVLHLQVVGDGGGQPLHVSDRYFPCPRFAGLDELVRQSGSITQAFAALGVPDYTRRQSRISARLPEAEVAAHLKQPAARPALYVSSVNVDPAGTPIEYACTWFAGDRVTLTVDHDHVG
ncbi:phosphonate metabolism transcriptional regulator PhnF [Hydrogenophaga sp. RWCD_12]|uniref:phosphonate metabolism transcriptional regulator PhnF n=1 Tax=Hydrogenophaga sp. RWCD_12 TaxID=3391190 RepID=UPI00398566C6